MRTAFATVIYSSAYKYRKDFIESLKYQTDKNFDLFILNDDVDETALKQFEKECDVFAVSIINSPHDMSIAQLRTQLLCEVKRRNYDLVILGDFDDAFSENRVEKIKGCFNNNVSFYYNELVTFDKQRVFENLPGQVNNIESILQSNFLGLSNTAINLNLFNEEFFKDLSSCTSDLFDWYLYTRILLEEHQGILVPDCNTFYRIHGNNLAGLSVYSLPALKKELDIKIRHYQLLCNYHEIYNKLLAGYKNLDPLSIPADELNPDKKGFWWEQIHLHL